MPIESVLRGTAQRNLRTEENLERGRIVKCSKEVRFFFQSKICCNQTFLYLPFLSMNNLFIKPLFFCLKIFIYISSKSSRTHGNRLSTKFSRNIFPRNGLQKAELAKLVLKNILKKKIAKKSFGSRFKKIDLNVTDYLL